MKTFLKIILGLAVLGGIAAAAVLFLTSGQREIARNFVLQSSAGQYDQARALLHPNLQSQFTVQRLREAFAGVEPYTNVSFASVESDGTGTRLTGSATTDSGCASKLSFEVLQGQIIAFDITPLCRR
ncbi:hypothetical protein [Rhodovulum adriaticum]|nr:hypothetical protein [Rhodovulum adriaticum]MBK1635587.1 hypothetical protein [Rhodovulum adriaticum]